MNKVVPYDDKIGYSDGGFVNTNGEIILVSHHEVFAREFCFGKDYEFLKSLKSGRSCYSFEDYKRDYNFNGSREEIDIFSSSKLTKEQLIILKKWLQKNERFATSVLSDFMTYVIKYDKIETIRRKSITTTSNQPYTRFYNYYLMDWNIDCLKPGYIFNEETGCFEFAQRDNIAVGNDREVKSELDEIKANVLRKDRYHFFK